MIRAAQVLCLISGGVGIALFIALADIPSIAKLLAGSIACLLYTVLLGLAQVL